MTQVKKYLEWLEYGRNLAPNTLKNVESDLRKFGEGIDEALRMDVERFVMKENKRGMSTASVARAVASLRGYFEWQLYNGLRNGLNPAAGKIAPKIKNKETKVLTKEELDYLYENAPTKNIKVAVALMGYAGLRIGEVIGIGKHNQLFYDDNGVLAVHLTQTKGDKERLVSLELIPDKDLIVATAQNKGLQSERGSLTENGLWRQLKAYFKKMKFDRLTPHGLRGTFSTILAESGVNSVIIRDLLGHSTLEGNVITSRYIKTTSVETQAKVLKEMLM